MGSKWIASVVTGACMTTWTSGCPSGSTTWLSTYVCDSRQHKYPHTQTPTHNVMVMTAAKMDKTMATDNVDEDGRMVGTKISPDGCIENEAETGDVDGGRDTGV